MKIKSTLTLLIASTTLLACGLSNQTTRKDPIPKPIQLFNGKDINNWTPKIRLHEVGENFGNTFRVEDGLLKVRYDQYDDFDQLILDSF